MSFNESLNFYDERKNLEKANEEVKNKMKEFFNGIENEELKIKIKEFFSFINNQKKEYFEKNEDGIIQFKEDKKKFLSENSDFDEESFNALLKSLKDRKLLAFDLDKSLKNDNLEDRDFVQENINNQYEKFMKLEHKTYDDILKMPREVRIMLCTKARVDMERIEFGDVTSLVFDFKFGKEKINKDIYLNTTAGQLLPAGVRQIEKNGVVYFRSGELGEFFTENNKRLTIHQDTHIVISKLQSKDEVLNNRNNIKKELDIEDEKNISLEDSIKLEAKLRGIDPKFAVIAFKDTLEKTPKEKQKYVLENMLTEFDRIRGYYRLSGKLDKDGKYKDNIALRLFYNLDSTNYENNAKKYGIDESKITKKEDMGEYLNFSKIEGISDIAKKLDVPKSILYAIFMNESSGRGLGKAVPRFEKHIYNKYISGKSKYKGRRATEEQARKLATSYGGMQIMGFNYKKVGYSSVEEFVDAQTGPNSEQEQLKAFANFLKNTPGMIDAMKTYNYEKIATLYNGPNHAQNNYVGKLKKYVKKYS